MNFAISPPSINKLLIIMTAQPIKARRGCLAPISSSVVGSGTSIVRFILFSSDLVGADVAAGDGLNSWRMSISDLSMANCRPSSVSKTKSKKILVPITSFSIIVSFIMLIL